MKERGYAMKWVMKIFVRGLVTMLPIVLSLYFIYWFFIKAEVLMKDFLGWLFPHLPYVTGMGVTLGFVLIFILGIIMGHVFVQRLFRWAENLMESVPIMKSIYTATKDLMQFFAPSEKGKTQKVVIIGRPGEESDRIGFLTNSSVNIEGLEGRVAVYMPMSYQIGGYTVFVPKSWVREVDLSVEEAMRSALTAWMQQKDGL